MARSLFRHSGTGAGTLAAPVHSRVGCGSAPRSISLGDLKGDGHLDTITHGANSLTVPNGPGNGRFVPAISVNLGHAVDSAVVGDVDGNGILDLVAVGNRFTCSSYGYHGC